MVFKVTSSCCDQKEFTTTNPIELYTFITALYENGHRLSL